MHTNCGPEKSFAHPLSMGQSSVRTALAREYLTGSIKVSKIVFNKKEVMALFHVLFTYGSPGPVWMDLELETFHKALYQQVKVARSGLGAWVSSLMQRNACNVLRAQGRCVVLSYPTLRAVRSLLRSPRMPSTPLIFCFHRKAPFVVTPSYVALTHSSTKLSARVGLFNRKRSLR